MGKRYTIEYSECREKNPLDFSERDFLKYWMSRKILEEKFSHNLTVPFKQKQEIKSEGVLQMNLLVSYSKLGHGLTDY